MSKRKKESTSSIEEETVLHFLEQQNRPFSVQNIVDFLQKEGIKKAACEKILSSLVEREIVSFKEYGKAKIYLFRQDTIEIPDDDELQKMDEEISTKEAEYSSLSEQVAQLEKQVSLLQSQMTLEQARDKKQELEQLVEQMEEKLQSLSSGIQLVDPAERRQLQQTLLQNVSQWKQRKRMAKDIFDAIAENANLKFKDLCEQIGIEDDESVGLDMEHLLSRVGLNQTRGTGKTKALQKK
eukprot:jgi/Galph1/2277/GphlegSOOS_G937.1